MPQNSAKVLANHARRIYNSRQLLAMFSIPLIWVIIFCYVPMYGVQIAFKDFNVKAGIWGSPWVGLKHFKTFFASSEFSRLIGNTLSISIYGILAGTPVPIILALCVNYLQHKFSKKALQMITYMPYFISTVVIVGIIYQMFSVSNGSINNIIARLGGARVNFISAPKYFRHLYTWSGVWQGMGYSAVIYIAALSGVDSSQVEAAVIDGAGRFSRVWHIDLPTILPTIVIQLILAVGGIMSIGFEKVYLMQNPVNLQVSEIIPTFVYKRGIANFQYSYAAAVGLFNSIINLALILIANVFAKKTSDTSLW